eukprot:1193943-Prorocentrum_minimum.AAC.2
MRGLFLLPPISFSTLGHMLVGFPPPGSPASHQPKTNQAPRSGEADQSGAALGRSRPIRRRAWEKPANQGVLHGTHFVHNANSLRIEHTRASYLWGVECILAVSGTGGP